jgi:MFS family permease
MLAQRFGLPTVRGAGGFVAAMFIDFLGTGLFAPFSLLYFTHVTGFSLPVVGLVLSAAMALTLPLVPVTGVLVERLGSMHVVLLAQILQGVGLLGYLVVQNVPLLFVTALLDAIGQRLFWSTYFTLIAEIAAPHERDRWYGLGAATRSAGLGLGGLLAGVAVGVNALMGYHLVVIVDGLSFFLAAGLLLFGVRATTPQRHDLSQGSGSQLLLKDRPFLILVAANVLFALCSLMLGIGVPVYLTTALRAPLWVAGVIIAFSTALIAVFQTIAVRMLEPYRRTRALILAGGLWGAWSVFLALALFVPRLILIPFLFVVTCLYALAAVIHDPPSNALAADASPGALRARYLAVFQLSWSIAGLIAPGLFALLFTLHPVLPWLVIAALILLASLTISWIEPHLPRRAVRMHEDELIS